MVDSFWRIKKYFPIFCCWFSKRFLRSSVQQNWCFRFRFRFRPENNWFLPRVYEPTTRAPVYWDFEIMILKAPEKTSHKVKLRLKGGTLGDQFLNTFGRSFLKNVAKTCRSRLSCQRAGNDQQMGGRSVTCRLRFLELPFPWHDSTGDSRFPALQGIV